MSVSSVQRNVNQQDDQNSNNVPNNNGNDMNNMFLKLLVAQIQNQDPTNPTDSSQYINQMAQLNQAQSLNNLSGQMLWMQKVVGDMQLFSLSNMVGKQVYIESNEITLQDKQSVDGRIYLKNPAGKVTLHIKDETGKTVDVELGKHEAGDVPFNLDPEELKKKGLTPGKCTVSVTTDTKEKEVVVEFAGIVSNVRVDPKTKIAMLSIPGLGEFAYDKIRQFGDKNSPTNNVKNSNYFYSPQTSGIV